MLVIKSAHLAMETCSKTSSGNKLCSLEKTLVFCDQKYLIPQNASAGELNAALFNYWIEWARVCLREPPVHILHVRA